VTPDAIRIREWRHDPIKFVWDNFKVTPDKWQADVLRDFGDQGEKKLRQSMEACVNPGKTAVLAWCGWNFLSCYGDIGNHPKGAAVAVTKDNLKDNLWPEFSKWQQRSEYLQRAFTWTKERIYATQHPETWFHSARSYSKDADPDDQGKTLSGLHSKFILIQLDESGEIPLPVLRAGEQAFADAECRIGRMQQAGNPSSLDGVLYAAATQLADQWRRYKITGDPDDPNRAPRVDIEWARTQIRLFGRDNPWVKYSVLGIFPEASINALLGPEHIDAAENRQLKPHEFNWAQKRLGVDVARFGDDMTIIFPRQGLFTGKPVEMRHQRTQAILGRILEAKIRWNWELCMVDTTGGYGSGVVDALISSDQEPHEVVFSQAANNPMYFNLRSEMWWEMAQWVKRGGRLPKIAELRKALTMTTYTYQNGKLRIEEKDQLKKRLKFSPDHADALACTFAIPDMPGALQLKKRGMKTITEEEDELQYRDDYDEALGYETLSTITEERDS
jgi:phage terminase large subunit